jgi:hypothetical protein
MNAAYDEAKLERDRLQAEMQSASAIMQTFPRGEMGLTPDHIKASPEWRAARARYQTALSAMQTFNATFIPRFKKEIAAERRAKCAARTVSPASTSKAPLQSP